MVIEQSMEGAQGRSVTRTNSYTTVLASRRDNTVRYIVRIGTGSLSEAMVVKPITTKLGGEGSHAPVGTGELEAGRRSRGVLIDMRSVASIPANLKEFVYLTINELEEIGRRGTRWSPKQRSMSIRLTRIWWHGQDLSGQEHGSLDGSTAPVIELSYRRPPGVRYRVFKESHAKLLVPL